MVRDLSEIVSRKVENDEGSTRVRLKIRIRPGLEPQIVEAPANTTIGELEEKIARKLSLNPANVRLHYNMAPLPRNKTVAEVRDMVGAEGVLETVPSHIFGMENLSTEGGASPSPIFFLEEKELIRDAPEVRRMYIDCRILGEMLAIFAEAALRGEEAMCLLTGRAQKGVAVLTTLWPAKVSHVSPVSVEPETGWLNKSIKEALKMGHNVILEAHRHPIGSAMSSTDRNSLAIISRWLKPAGITALIACCDVSIGVYGNGGVQTDVEVWTAEKTIEELQAPIVSPLQHPRDGDENVGERRFLARVVSFFKGRREKD